MISPDPETISSAQRERYSSYTFDSKNPIKRALHRYRFANILKGLGIGWQSRILDYGAGDGRLFRILIDSCGVDPGKLVAFDPVPKMVQEFTSLVPEVRIVDRREALAVPAGGEEFDFIFCCEVLEHLSAAQIDVALGDFLRLAGRNTKILIAVPIEIGPIGLAKNLYRRFCSNVDIPLSVMAKALFGIEQERTPRLTQSNEAVFEHPGFSFRSVRRRLTKSLVIHSEFNDPFRHAPFIINNSRVFVARLG